jgi:hypothetical protein
MGTDKERETGPVAAEMTPSRRQALARLGFATAVAYAAPTILHLDRSAKAQILPSCENPPGGGPPDPSCDALNLLDAQPGVTGGAGAPPAQ